MTTTIYWPQSLPQEQFLSLTFQRRDTRLQTQPDLGAPRMRPRSILNLSETTAEAIFTGTQFATFDDFWKTTLRDGALRFLWRHPLTDMTVEMSFANYPAVRPEASHQDPNQRLLWLAMPLRIHT
ncbi:MAG TPA: hypothetical protein VN716_18915 [Vicinamibacterales bacterium]|nr:hypothetical protein [Vicinamibacterales bacterium]